MAHSPTSSLPKPPQKHASSAGAPSIPAAKAAPAAMPPLPAKSSSAGMPPAPPAKAAAPASPAPSVKAAPSPSHRPTVSLAGLPPSLAAMIEAIDLYDAILTEENTLLRTGDAKGVAALLDRKVAATQLYQERLRALLADEAGRKTLSAEQRAKTTALAHGLEERAKENALLLKANMTAIEHVIEAVNGAARRSLRKEVGYSGKGDIRETYGAQGGAIAINRTI